MIKKRSCLQQFFKNNVEDRHVQHGLHYPPQVPKRVTPGLTLEMEAGQGINERHGLAEGQAGSLIMSIDDENADPAGPRASYSDIITAHPSLR